MKALFLPICIHAKIFAIKKEEKGEQGEEREKEKEGKGKKKISGFEI